MQECWINVYKWWNNYSGEWAIYVGTECFNSNYDAQMYSMGMMINNDLADTRKYRRDIKKRGPYGTDWYKYQNGVPPEDDDNDYEWTGNCWQRTFEDD